ncbi:MAG: zinc ABC transporter substrate-binding protein, partial [Dehalococcoidales bacterium]
CNCIILQMGGTTMKKAGVFAVVTLVLLATLLVGGCSSGETSQLKVVTSTALIAQIVERIGGDMVDVINIIPPAQCPGHFDVKPGDIQKLADAEIFLMHNWQGEQFTQEIITSADNPDLGVGVISIAGNWMTPSVQQEATDVILDFLKNADSENSAAYQELADKYKAEVEAKGAQIETRLAGENLEEVNVMCNEQIAGLVQWIGLNVIATYDRPDSLTPQVVMELVDKAREEGVVLFIDNLQSGADASAQMAEEIGCNRVTLTNFPGGFDGTETWEKAIDYNVELVLDVLSN